MEGNPNNPLIDLAYRLFNRIDDTDFEYIYRGNFSQKISKNLLALAETNVKDSAGRTSLKNKIYFVMVEGLQNVTKHRDKDETDIDGTPDSDGMFAIQKNLGHYYITTGNIVKKNEENTLKPKLEQINIMERDDLTLLRKEILKKGDLSDKGGAGLGFIEMARKSGKKLMFDFEPVNEQASFFYFRTEIPGNDTTEINNSFSDESKSLDDVKHLNEALDHEKILISFNGRFNRENTLSLLSVIKGQMNVSMTSKKVYAVMVELLQNISKHTSDIEGDKKNRGIFMLSKKEDTFVLTAGNLLHAEDVPKMKDRLEFINNLSDKELYNQYDMILLDIGSANERKTGLGFIDMRIKSTTGLNYIFKDINAQNTFFVLQVTIKN